MDKSDLAKLGDIELALRLKKLVAEERATLATQLAYLAEFDRRELFAPLGYPSLFVYCTKVLFLSEDAAYRRIQVARASRHFPEILALLNRGELSLAAASLLAPHLNNENRTALLAQASGKTKREVEMMIAAFAPKPERRDCVRRLPEAAATLAGDFSLAESCAAAGAHVPATSVSLPPPPKIVPVAPDRIRFSFTGDDALLRKLGRAREVLKHKYPAGKLEDIFAEALELLLEKKDPARRARRQAREAGLKRQPPPALAVAETRRIPQWVKDEVWTRDAGQCAFTAPDGTRCPEKGGLEFDHVIPWALGGRSHDPANIRLLCRAHNQIRARRMFGESAMARERPP